MPQNGIIKTFRSSTSGNVPPTGTRQTGELWVNMADGQLGYIDATATAQKLLGVRNYSNLANYLMGDFVVYAGQLYRAIANTTAGAFNAANWTPVGGSVSVGDTPPSSPQQGALWFNSSNAQLYAFYNGQWVIAVNQGGAYLSSAGGALSGNLAAPSLSAPDGTSAPIAKASPAAGDSSQALATTSWVQSTLAGRQNRNRIINGSFCVDQRNSYAVYTAPVGGNYFCDRWTVGATQASKFSTRVGDFSNLGYQLNLTSLSAYTSLVTDYFFVMQRIEGFNIADFQWGTSNAKPVTLSFFALASVAGTYSGAIAIGAAILCYPFTFTLSAGILTPISITIPGATTGTWAVDSTGAMSLLFDLGSGANFRAPAGAWTSGNFIGANGAASLVATNGATLQFANVQLELGTQATPFDWRPYGEELALCQRYYVKCNAGIIFTALAGGASQPAYQTWEAPVCMRAAPTVSASWSSPNNAGAIGVSVLGDNRTLQGAIQSGVAGFFSANLLIDFMDAEL